MLSVNVSVWVGDCCGLASLPMMMLDSSLVIFATPGTSVLWILTIQGTNDESVS